MTGEYFQQGRWTLNSDWAEQFSDVAKALVTCLRHDLWDVVLVLQFGLEAGRNYSLQLSLPDRLAWARF